MKAHDVRHLRMCEICGSLADDRETIRPRGPHFEVHYPEKYNLKAHWHPGCYVQKFGEDAVFILAAEERRKFRLCDVSRETMLKLLESF